MALTLISKIVAIVAKFLPFILPVIEQIKQKGFKQGLKDGLKAIFKTSEVSNTDDDLKSVLLNLTDIMQQLGGEDSAFFKTFLGKLTNDGELTGLALVVKEALADGKITQKEMALIILAYELEVGEIAKEDIKVNDTLTEMLGFKTNQATLVQVSKVRNKLVSQAEQ